MEKTSSFVDKIENWLPLNAKVYSERIFMAVFTVCLIILGFRNTMLNLPLRFKGSMIMMCSALFFAMVLQWITHIRDKRKLIAAVMLIAVYGGILIVNRHGYSRFDMLTILFLTTAGAIGIEYKKILKRWVYTVGSVMLITFTAAFTGAAENLVRYAGGIRLKMRGSLGVIYPTDTASWIFFILIVSWITFDRIPDVLMIIMAVLSLIITKGYCDSRCSMICTILFILIILYRIIEKKVVEEKGKLNFIKRTMNLLALISVPVGAAAMIVLSILYGKEKSVAYRINKLIDYRLQYSWDALKEHGITVFGSDFRMVGDGNNYIRGIDKYTFLDSSYISILIRYGILAGIILLLMWIFVMVKAIKVNDRRMLLVMALIAIHSFEEHHFIEILYNPLTATTFCLFIPNSIMVSSPAIKTERSRKGVIAAVSVGAVVIYLMALPWMLSVYRTVMDITDAKHSVMSIVTALIMIVIYLFGLGICIFGVKKLLNSSERVVRKKAWLYIISGITAIFVLTVAGTVFINLKRNTYREQVEADKDGIDIIMQAKTYPVFANEYPYAYMKAYKGFSNSFWTDDDMARYRHGTMLFDKGHESYCAINRGYMYVPISDHTGVYTNDKSVADAFTEKGYHVTGYYSSEKNIEINDGELEKINILPGKYLFTAVLKKEDRSEKSDNSETETLNLIRVYDGSAVATRDIGDADFGGSDTASVEMMMDVPAGIRQLGYEILPQDAKISLQSLSYVRKPDFDTRYYYNDIYQVVREEYYDGEGNRITSESGEAAVEYEYDDRRNNTITRYYGVDYKPVLINKGYAEIHNEYDDLHHITAVSYYGTDGKPIALTNGSSSETREIDHIGNILVRRYFGTDGNPVMITGGFAEIDRNFDDKKRMIREEYKDTEGNPVRSDAGYAALERAYDGNDNVTEQYFYDTDGTPILSKSGYAGLQRAYDGEDRIIMERYTGTKGEPITVTGGFTELRRKYDENDNIAEESYYGADGRLTLIDKGYAMIRRVYDPLGRMTEVYYFGTDERPIELPLGHASDRREYDQNGNLLAEIFYGADGKKKLINRGFAEVRWEYNSFGQIIREEYYGLTGERVNNSEGYAVEVTEYDPSGEKKKTRYNLAGEMVSLK